MSGIQQSRFIEIDLLRSFAISLMIFFHLLWDLDYFQLIELDVTLYSFSRSAPILFLVLTGICMAVQYERKSEGIYKKLIFHGTKIFAVGAFLSIVTFMLIPERPIIFGILHCIGLSMIISSLLLRYKQYNIVFAAVIFSISILFSSMYFEHFSVMHLVLGIHPIDIFTKTIDYFPLVPWLGFCLFGVAIGNILYRDNIRRFKMPDLVKYRPVRLLSLIGRHSFPIYLIHQPVIGGSMYLWTYFSLSWPKIMLPAIPLPL